MRLHSYLLFLLLFPFGLLAQNPVLDSLRNELKNSRNDSAKVENIVNLAVRLQDFNPDSSSLLCRQAGQLAAQLEKPEIRVLALRKVGLGYVKLTQLDSAQLFLEKALSLAETINFNKGQAFAHNSLGSLHRSKNESTLALEHFEQALELHRLRGDLNEESADLSNVALIYMEEGEYAKAAPYFERAVAIQDSIGNRRYQAIFLHNLALCESNQRNFERAITIDQQALELWEALDDQALQALCHSALGGYYRSASDFTTALGHYQTSLRLRESLGNEIAAASSRVSIGNLYLDLKDYPNSIDNYRRALRSLEESENKPRQARALTQLGQALKKKGDFQDALDTLYLAVRLRREAGPERYLPYPLYYLGSTYQKMNQADSAFYYLQEANSLAKTYNIAYVQMLSQADLAIIMREKGAKSEAITMLEEAYRLTPLNSYQGDKLPIYDQLYQLYKEQNDYSRALQYLESSKSIQDSIFNTENTLEVARLEANYTFEQQKQQLEFEQAREIARQRSSRLGVLIALGLAVLIILIITWYYRQKQRANTQLLRLNEEITAQKAQLEELDKMKSRFFTNIAHELRTPLSLIKGPVQSLLENSSLQESARQMATLINNNARILHQRVNQILDLTKLDSSKMELEEKPTDIQALTHRIITLFESNALQKDINMVFSPAEEGPLFAQVDSRKLDTILENYLSNALKFTPRGGEIRISLQEENGFLQWSVQDTGKGIPAAETELIFERYYQADQADQGGNSTEGGTGIGLALCRELAEFMGGKVWVKSELNKGSTFYFALPYQPTGAVEVPEELSAIAFPVIETSTPVSEAELAEILLVEDNPDLNLYLEKLLLNRRISVAENGQEALDLLEKNNFDLIISDIMMPVMNGFELLNRLKAHPQHQHIPVIMLTALLAEEDKMRALRLGVDDYISKPFSPGELLLRVNNMIKNVRRRREFLEKDPAALKFNFEATSSEDQTWLATLETAAQEALDKQIGLTRTYLADHMGMSDRQLLRRLKGLTGLTVKDYIVEVKLQKARHLLESNTYQTIAEVAHASGFASPGYFSQLYFKHFGKKPGDVN